MLFVRPFVVFPTMVTIVLLCGILDPTSAAALARVGSFKENKANTEKTNHPTSSTKTPTARPTDTTNSTTTTRPYLPTLNLFLGDASSSGSRDFSTKKTSLRPTGTPAAASRKTSLKGFNLILDEISSQFLSNTRPPAMKTTLQFSKESDYENDERSTNLADSTRDGVQMMTKGPFFTNNPKIEHHHFQNVDHFPDIANTPPIKQLPTPTTIRPFAPTLNLVFNF